MLFIPLSRLITPSLSHHDLNSSVMELWFLTQAHYHAAALYPRPALSVRTTSMFLFRLTLFFCTLSIFLTSTNAQLSLSGPAWLCSSNSTIVLQWLVWLQVWMHCSYFICMLLYFGVSCVCVLCPNVFWSATLSRPEFHKDPFWMSVYVNV